ncbi:DNA sulfur modification protein DndE [Pseudomonas aeruginosa]|uniref:DNA sulfur modification protein DndE n=1 Tax=Pseudomonas TaxID=286 RepID=UPI00355921C8|nr:DNA sulfur modification protein DndE [Pseudomonas aeruginosa]
MMIRTLHLSERAKEQLVRLKRLTGFRNWNVLCRWALCTSLSDPSPVSQQKIITDSNVELSWAVLTGEWGEVYEQLLYERCELEGVEPSPDGMHELLIRHVHRGIGMLGAETRGQGVSLMLRAAVGEPQ